MTTPPAPHAGVKASVAQQFSNAAANYSTSPIHAAGADLQAMITAAALAGHERVLDAGCGPGHTALAFAPQVAHVVALDLADSMLEQGRRLAADRAIANVKFRQGDVEHLPFGPATFDLVTTRYSAHHWPHPAAALAEFRRVLRPGGYLLLADVVSFDDYTVDTYFQAIELLRDTSHVRDHTTDQWLALLGHAGFDTEIAHKWTIYIDFASWVARMRTPLQQIAMLRTLLAAAPHEVKSALQIRPDGSFTMQCSLFQAVPRGV
jgi:ubiquinone/menaquinone biosynthesis C-methylase UbiE